MKTQKMVLRCLSVSGVSSTKKIFSQKPWNIPMKLMQIQKHSKTVLRCLSVSGVSSTQKMQILRTKLALMRREYYQEEEKIAKHREEVFPGRDVKTSLGIIETGGRRTWTSLLLRGAGRLKKIENTKERAFLECFSDSNRRTEPSQPKKKENATKSTKASSVQSYHDTLT